MSRGKLILIPTTLGTQDTTRYLIPESLGWISKIQHYVVENEKTARRDLRRASRELDLDQIQLFPLNKRTRPEDLSDYLLPAMDGKNIGLLSEAGCPAVADPGAVLVAMAHERGIEVVPLVGPSSILMTLMASGFNGQAFQFHGYLPKEQRDRQSLIKDMEMAAVKRKSTQLFMDTPFRNMNVLEDLLNYCKHDTWLCIAVDISLESEDIRSAPIADWKKRKINLHKRPCMFALGMPQRMV